MCRTDSDADGKWSDELHVDRWIIRYTECGYTSINDDDDLYGHGHDEWLQQYSGIDGYGKSVTNS